MPRFDPTKYFGQPPADAVLHALQDLDADHPGNWVFIVLRQENQPVTIIVQSSLVGDTPLNFKTDDSTIYDCYVFSEAVLNQATGSLPYYYPRGGSAGPLGDSGQSDANPAFNPIWDNWGGINTPWSYRLDSTYTNYFWFSNRQGPRQCGPSFDASFLRYNTIGNDHAAEVAAADLSWDYSNASGVFVYQWDRSGQEGFEVPSPEFVEYKNHMEIGNKVAGSTGYDIYVVKYNPDSKSLFKIKQSYLAEGSYGLRNRYTIFRGIDGYNYVFFK